MRPCGLLWLVIMSVAVVGGAAAQTGTSEAPRGGTFRLSLQATDGFDAIDPAAVDSPPEGLLVRATCAHLMAFPGPKPELSDGYPTVSRDRLTYTFRIKPGFRFSSGEPVAARNVAHAIERVLGPVVRDDAAVFVADRFVGGRAFHEGKAKTIRGVTATGNTLVFRLTKPWPQLLYDLTAPQFCPVPAALPPDAEGVGAPLPGSGPYFVESFEPNRQATLARNPFYGGSRPQHVDGFAVDLTSNFEATARRVVEGAADLAFPTPPEFAELVRRYGVNRSQLFLSPAPEAGPRMIVLNSRRPLFRDNPTLRRAVNYAIDRRALVDLVGGGLLLTPTDQYLSPLAAGFRDERIYPLRGDLRKARALARGNTRSGKAVIYSSEVFPFVLAQSKLVQQRLRLIGIEAEIKTFPHAVFLRKLTTPGEPFDLANSLGFVSGYPDHTALNCMFHRRGIPPAPDGCNYFYFDSPRFNRLLDRADRLVGPARFRAYGRLDIELARDAAPAVPYIMPTAPVLVSKRASCHRFDRPLYDLAVLCLAR